METSMHGMGRIFKRGQTWWIAYNHRGTEHRESARSAKEADARRLLRYRLAQIQTKTFVGPSEDRITFDDLAEGLLRNYAVRKLRSPQAAALRIRNLRVTFGDARARDISTAAIEAYQAQRLAGGAAGATINRELSALRRAFVLAVRGGRLSTMPIFPDRVEEDAPRQGFAEHGLYLAVRRYLPGHYQDVLDFGYWSGWRRQEIQRLPWSMVDMGANVLRLSPEFSKSKEGRVIPIPPPLREVLLRRMSQRRLACVYVFHVNGGRIGDWRKTWHRACGTAGVPGFIFHDLRRTAVRNLDRAGVPRSVAMAMVGHKTEAIYRRYNIVSERDLHEAGVKLAAYIATLPTTPTVTPLQVQR
jgi:integrase